MQSVFILGRQPALGLAELESLYGADAVKAAGTQAAVVDVEPADVDFDRLGGATKFGRLLTVIDASEWHAVEKFLIRECPKHAEMVPEGKMTIGLSAYGYKVSPAQVQATALSVKKAIKKSGRPVRIVPNKETELSTAQVLHNGLTSDTGWELFVIKANDRSYLVQTAWAQDIESYTVRDRERPKRDARVGMLPPKLAQILINLAVGTLPVDNPSSAEYMEDEPTKTTPGKPQVRPTILDPFCGTGVVLQEALLTGYSAYGTDIDARMVAYTKENIEWLKTAFEFGDYPVTVEQGDATNYQWPAPFTHVACETYLGRPFTSVPSPEILNRTVSECNVIIKKFLKNIHGQLPEGGRMCLAVPAWQVKTGKFKHLPLLDSLEELGYNRISFEQVRDADLLYYRPDQVVARELLILEKK